MTDDVTQKAWLALAENIAAEGSDYMPGPAEFQALDELEHAGLADLATILHPVAATYRLTEKGERWLGERRRELGGAS